MAHSSLVGIDRAPAEPDGRDSDRLGPSDTSDSGSDVAGVGVADDGGPAAPLDAALGDDAERPLTTPESIGDGIDSDAAGSGERRSAAGDGGALDGADIAPDRVVAAPDDDRELGDALDDTRAGLLSGSAALDEDDAEGDEEIEDGGRDAAPADDEDADPVGKPPQARRRAR